MGQPGQHPGRRGDVVTDLEQVSDHEWHPEPLAHLAPAAEAIPTTAFPIFEHASLLRTWAGIVDVCPDASPIVGPTPIDGLFLNCSRKIYEEEYPNIEYDELIIDAAPLLAAPPVQEITSPGLRVFLTHP